MFGLRGGVALPHFGQLDSDGCAHRGVVVDQRDICYITNPDEWKEMDVSFFVVCCCCLLDVREAPIVS